MKTPDEIKKGLAECTECCELQLCARSAIHEDALDYIQQLETERHQLLTRCERLERERDAAVADMCTGVCCETCIYADTDATEPPCATCAQGYSFGNWEWRGVKEE